MSRRHTLIRYDWRGCGLSDRERVEFSFERLVEDLEAVIEAAGLERFVFFGMAAGSAIGVNYAVRHPERVSRLVLYASYVRNKLAGNPTPQQVEEAQARLKMMELGWALDDFLPAPPADATGTGSLAVDELTAREHQVLELVAQGLDNTSIGERLHISERTARNHVSTILGKLGVNTRAQAIVRAREAGFGSQKVR